MKFALGVVFICLGFLVLPIGTHWFSDQGRIASQWLAFSYFLQTIGELLLSPVGLSMITALVPKHLVGMMMGVWFFAQAVSFALGGTLANLAAIPESVSGLASLPLYEHAFILFGILSGVLAIVSFLFIPFLKRLIGNIAV